MIAQLAPPSKSKALLQSPLSNKIVNETGFFRVGNIVTYNAGWIWIKDGVNYTNAVPNELTFLFCSAGKKRIDRIVLTKNNSFAVLIGTETLGNPIAETLPDDCLDVSFVTVTDNGYTLPTAPIVGTNFRTKTEQGQVIMGTDASTHLILSYEATIYYLQGTQVDIRHFANILYNSPLFDGREIDIVNEQLTNLILRHQYATGNPLLLKFWFSNLLDYILKPGERCTLKYRIDKNRFELKSSNVVPVVSRPYPAPYLEELIPDSYRPSTTGNFVLRGSYLTKDMTIAIRKLVGGNYIYQTINSRQFVSDNEFRVNCTTSPVEGYWDVVFDGEIFLNALYIIEGDVFKPSFADWTNKTGQINLADAGEAKIDYYETEGSAIWNKEFDFTQNFYVQFNIAKSPLGYTANNEYGMQHIILLKSDNSFFAALNIRREGGGDVSLNVVDATSNPIASNLAYSNSQASSSLNFDVMALKNFGFRCLGGILYVYVNALPVYEFPAAVVQNLKLKVKTKSFDIINAKYIML